ncbi:hypothetical protein HPB51_026333 [Rhipicephalus microplus]|uniref:Uncharacterized protein n=1 Tax=Rhipicephalus microplus TaxID=6941 RepID=A0A9J6D3B2_RHIMP|nr:hypothetical protein HPB51_026333 [Rhipicephalus microplus]
MATPDQPQTEAVPPLADEKWVMLQDSDDAAKEVLLEEQDGDAVGDEKSLEGSVDGQQSAFDPREFLCWCRSAWQDLPICNDRWDAIRPYVLGVAVTLNTVLHFLTEMAVRGELTTLHVLLTCLGNFTMAVFCTAVFSYTTRFISLLAAKASAVKRLEVNALLVGLLVANVVVLLAACFAGLYEVIAGFKVFALARREKLFKWYLQLPMECFVLHGQDAKELYISKKRRLDPLKSEPKKVPIMVVCFLCYVVIIKMMIPTRASSSAVIIIARRGRVRASLLTIWSLESSDLDVATSENRSPQGRRQAHVMAASNHHEAEVVPSAAAEQWVLLRRDGDAGREQLLEEQNGDTGKNTPNATEGLGSAVDAEKGWLRSAWNDVSIRNALWNDRRRHVLLATVCANTVFHVLAVWQAEYGPLQALFSCLKHFTTATQCAAVFSMATKFLSLTALKPSPPLKKGQWNYKSGDLVLVNAMILLAACFACTYEVRVGIRVSFDFMSGVRPYAPRTMCATYVHYVWILGKDSKRKRKCRNKPAC